jgi:hypothetical protein
MELDFTWLVVVLMIALYNWDSPRHEDDYERPILSEKEWMARIDLLREQAKQRDSI